MSYVHPRYRKVETATVAPTVTETATPITPPTVKETTTVVRSLPCLYLESRVNKGCTSCWKKQFHSCSKLNIQCRPGVECQTCDAYEADN